MKRPNITLTWLKIQLSAKSVFKVFRNYKYILVAIFTTLLFFEIVFWLFNLNILLLVMTGGGLTVLEKIQFLSTPLSTIIEVNGLFIAVFMIIVSILQGVNVALLTFVIKKQPKIDGKILGGGSLIGLLAIIGLGCPSCGTSLITPIVAIFLSGSAAAVSSALTVVALPIAALIALYGVYILGIKAANIIAKSELGS